ncbi:outer membrane protein assembly factor BamB [Hydrogenophaga sp. RWCD_12]|uniref:outer membrane protein assembly factor BamB n=1 Tax=Hydrogenophaga sp. RWCD_12 TaxID=3391190 RepID=UPI003984B152
MNNRRTLTRRALSLVALTALVVVGACSSGPAKVKPADLPPPANKMSVQVMWSTQVGASASALAPFSLQGRVYLAGGSGTLAVVDALSGKDVWRLNLGTPLATGPGSDGQVTAVVTQSHQLVAIAEGREVWRAQLPSASYTAPLVAGKRVFVLTADRSVLAFDGQTGARLWTQSRPGEPLVLRQPGVLLAVGDTLVAGLSGRLVGLSPGNGAPRWDVQVANSRGTNEVERLVDLVGPVSRVGNSVCARAYNSSVACVDADSGRAVWNKPAQGVVGVHGDAQLVLGSEADGRVVAWRRASGDKAWELDRLKYRELSAPLSLERLMVVGDDSGQVHVLSTTDGSEQTRLSTDGSAVVAAPVLSGPALVVQTRNGGVFAWRPQP